MNRNDSTASGVEEVCGTAAAQQRLHDWLYERTLPFWQQHGIDRESGGFHERLDLDCRPILSDGKRLIVQARQIYVFSQACIGGLLDSALETAQHGFKFLVAHYRLDDGWRHSVRRDGTNLDARCEFYDQAFVIFALAWLYRASGDKTVLSLAESTLDFLDTTLADKANGGFGEGLAADGSASQQPRRQNPHMHLLEALMALHDATGDDGYLNRAAALITLAKDRFIVDGSLREYFTADLKPLSSLAGRQVEPGHHFEWVWLLSRFNELAGASADVSAMADQLYRFAVEHGIDAQSGRVFDEVDCDGKQTKSSHRVWPQAEALKAHAARWALAGDLKAEIRLDGALAMLLRDHLSESAPGAWCEHRRPDGTSMVEAMPASTLYHLVFACSEIERLAPRIDD